MFTPSWICNAQNNLVDEHWFGRPNVFNIPQDNTWTATERIVFPEDKPVSYTHLDVYKRQGYDRAKFGFDCDTCGIITSIDEQSCDIALGVDKGLEAKNGRG